MLISVSENNKKFNRPHPWSVTNIVGEKFGSLTVIERLNKKTTGEVTWKCQCICKNTVVKSTSQLRKWKWGHCRCSGLKL